MHIYIYIYIICHNMFTFLTYLWRTVRLKLSTVKNQKTLRNMC